MTGPNSASGVGRGAFMSGTFFERRAIKLGAITYFSLQLKI